MIDSIKLRNDLLKKEGSDLLCHPTRFPAKDIDFKINPALQVIFSPDPINGWPSSDLFLMNEGNVNSDVRRFLENLNKPIQTEILGNFDDDLVLDTMMYRDDSLEDYQSRVDNILTEADFEQEPNID